MTIRKAQAQDVGEVHKLVISLAHFYLEDDKKALPLWFKETLTEEAFLSRFNHDDYLNYVYLQDNKLAGYIALKGGCHLFHLFVGEQYQCRGIARALWQHTLEQGSAKTFTLRSSLYAVPVYKKFGFIETEACAERDGIKYQAMAYHTSILHS